MKIKVTEEGREGIYLPDKESIKAFIVSKNVDEIHHFIPTRSVMLGADRSVKSVLEDIDNAERLAIMTGQHYKENMRHALALIIGNRLEIYDIGKITKKDLEVSHSSTK